MTPGYIIRVLLCHLISLSASCRIVATSNACWTVRFQLVLRYLICGVLSSDGTIRNISESGVLPLIYFSVVAYLIITFDDQGNIRVLNFVFIIK